MVVGLDRFRAHFSDYTDRYVLIGGVASELALSEIGLEFRATKDLDVVLIVEALDVAFAKMLWEFIKMGGYRECQKSEGSKPRLYRFMHPTDRSFPVMIELFSRLPDGLQWEEGANLTPLPIDEEVSSLSAILLDDDYYRFIVDGRREDDSLSFIGPDRLIPLKAHAFLDMTARKERGENVDSRHIRKHRNDVLLLIQALIPGQQIRVPAVILDDLHKFIAAAKASEDNLKSLGIRSVGLQGHLDRLSQAFMAM